MFRSLLAISVLAATPAHGAVACFNKLVTGTTPLKIELKLTSGDAATAVATFAGARCRLKQIKYNPVSPKYKGWIRVGTPRGDCQDLGMAMFGKSDISKKPMRVYWLSLSEEVQGEMPGLVQVGYENDVNPEKGPEAKMIMDCFTER